MSSIVFLYASSWAFFVGAGLIVAAACVRPFRSRVAKTLMLVGLVAFVAPSSTPLPWAVCVALLVCVGWWWSGRRNHWARNILIAAWTTAAGFEALHFMTPSVRTGNYSSLKIAVVGDSLTSGLSETRAVRWPRLLSKWPGVEYAQDFAVEGATCRKALLQAERIPEGVDLVVVAIGGNDVLGQTSLAEFERDYDALLNKIGGSTRALVGFELPLPPFHNDWGLAQRKIARKHGVNLIPKWRLMWILANPKNTVDSIHPTQAGQEAIAELVGSTIAP